MILKKILYFIIVLAISAIYPVFQYSQGKMVIIDTITITLITFAVLHLLYKINTKR